MFDAYFVVCYCQCFLRIGFLRIGLSSIATRLESGAGEGIRTPDLLITNQLLYRPELRQHKRQTLARLVPYVQVVGRSDYGRALTGPATFNITLFWITAFSVPPGRFAA